MTTDTIKTLNNLLEYLHDSRNGYNECAQQISDQRFKMLFSKFCEKRGAMINDLESEIRSLGGSPQKGDSLTAKAHRIFIDLKSFITGGDMESIVNEVDRGETTTISKYRDALNETTLPDRTRSLLNNQVIEIENNLRSIHELEHA